MFAFNNKYFILSILILLTALGFAVKSYQQADTSPQNTLTIGLQSGYPPFEYKDSEGKFIGFDIDVAEHIAKTLGKTLVIKDMDFEGIILSLKQKKIDLIMSGMNITPSRLKEIAMVPYHGEALTSLSLIFWNKLPDGIHSIEDLSQLPNATVSVESGAIPEMTMGYYPGIPMSSFQGAQAALMDVKFGKSIANLVEPDVAKYHQSKHPEIKILSVPIPEEQTVMGFGIGIKKENQELTDDVQQIIQELKESGELKKLEDKWFKGVKE